MRSKSNAIIFLRFAQTFKILQSTVLGPLHIFSRGYAITGTRLGRLEIFSSSKNRCTTLNTSSRLYYPDTDFRNPSFEPQLSKYFEFVIRIT